MFGIKNQSFGLELEFTGITRQQAAWAIAMVLNGNTDYTYEGGVYHKCTVRDSSGRKWIVESDSSIVTDGGEECEFVTPKCDYSDMETVQECIRALRKAGAKVNSSCGIHVHVDGANHNAKSLKNLVFMFRAKEELIFKAVAPNRKDNYYCKPIDDALVENIKKIKKLDASSMQSVWYDTYADRFDSSYHYHKSRYHALNLHSMWYRGTVEFRLFNSTLHAGEVRSYITLALAMSAAALNAKRVNADVQVYDNDRNAMKCWLWRIGITGEEWRVVLNHLTKNLSSDGQRISA